ncbi:5-carboxymethyl-2-hydroxymuconate Delta-isomerase [Flavobacteriaceae bacterium UJ101]|nr:5-carboxymethyl-2-hydroxymuconate Delta-isomerase [Flavobacteriaceae bacterium UJ101]
MKIICIGRNYANHAKELGNQIPKEPVIFMKPESALSLSDTFLTPSFSEEIHYELEIVVKINQKGKNISKEEAPNFYNELALGIDFTARDIQSNLKSKGLPWEKAKAFDQSAFLSRFFSKEIVTSETFFSLKKNNQTVQEGQTKNMLFSINELIENCSKYFTLEEGDLIYTGTPEGVGPIIKGDKLEGFIEEESFFKIEIM